MGIDPFFTGARDMTIRVTIALDYGCANFEDGYDVEQVRLLESRPP